VGVCIYEEGDWKSVCHLLALERCPSDQTGVGGLGWQLTFGKYLMKKIDFDFRAMQINLLLLAPCSSQRKLISGTILP
jgi:hypothetical protein